MRALRLIGGPRARTTLEKYLGYAAEEVVNELVQAVNPLRVRAIKKFVENAGNFWRDYAPLRHLKSRDLVEISEAATILNLHGAFVSAVDVSRFTHLEKLSLRDTQVADLAPLAGLEWLVLDATQAASNDLAITALRARGVDVHVF